MSDIRLDFAVHEFACPHCEKQTQYSWPGSTILFSTAKCQHCGMEFLVVQNKPWLSDNRANGQSL
jgi:transcription elongation factor Elf1